MVDRRFLPEDTTVKVEPDCRVAVKSVLPTIIDSKTSAVPETVRLTVLPRESWIEITVLVARETSLYAAIATSGTRPKPRQINNFFIMII